jgi:probable HAF family extracellular repeat protein
MHAFRWTASGGMEDLGTLDAAYVSSSATGINNFGYVVGDSQTDQHDTSGFLWTPEAGGSMTAPFGTLGGVDSLPYAINDAGQVVGRSLTTNGERHPFVWTAVDGIIDLGTLGGADGFAYGVNDAGQIVGRSVIGPSVDTQHATLWSTTLDPVVQIESLVQDIEDLVAGGSLRSAQANGLTRPLANALRSLERNHLTAACAQLHPLTVEVTHRILQGALSPGQGVALIEAIDGVRANLGCP